MPELTGHLVEPSQDDIDSEFKRLSQLLVEAKREDPQAHKLRTRGKIKEIEKQIENLKTSKEDATLHAKSE